MRLPRCRFSHIAAAGVGRAALGQAGSVCGVPGKSPAVVSWVSWEWLGLWVLVAQSCWQEHQDGFSSLMCAFGK